MGNNVFSPPIQTSQTSLLKFITAGSVDDGKSTLIGRLLYDSGAVSHDVLQTIERQTKNKAAGQVDLALLTDGLRAEREQGITIDVAYKYFHTDRRKFIIADAPGHVQYTRNMVTGSSNADLAIILIDARQGVVEQTFRHSLVAALMGLPHIVVAVNKMDLVDFDRETFEKITAEYQLLATRLNLPDVFYIPLSALSGDNVVARSARLPWYDGPALLEHLETVDVRPAQPAGAARFQVQYVIRPLSDDWHDYRGYAGTLRGGRLRVGDRIAVLPSGLESTVKAIEINQREVPEARANQAVVVHIADDIDIGRGDSIVRLDERAPLVSRDLLATVCWMSERPLRRGDRLLLRHHAATVKAVVREIHYRTDVHTFDRQPADSLRLNDIASVYLHVARPLVFDPYRENRQTGGFILIDENSFDTVAGGLLEGAAYTPNDEFNI